MSGIAVVTHGDLVAGVVERQAVLVRTAERARDRTTVLG
jgi:hypothetical protein